MVTSTLIPKLLSLGKSGITNLNQLNATCQQNDIPLPNDPEGGQLLVITNDQAAKEYKITQTGKTGSLLDIMPDVEGKDDQGCASQAGYQGLDPGTDGGTACATPTRRSTGMP
jgi:hypothetical protein